MEFSNVDIGVFTIYALFIIGLGIWVSRKKSGESQTSKDYFLAGKSLPWYAIGASLIASNISAEQIIGMSGSGYVMGMAIAAYELMAAATLLLVAKYFLPIYLDKQIFTMPQFLELRYDNRVKTSLAVFWLLLYVFVNLTAVMFLGALTLETVIGVPFIYGVIGLAAFSILYSIYGGLKAVAYTDIVQVIFLVIGGIMTTYIALNLVSDGGGFIKGFSILAKDVPDKFDMIFQYGHPNYVDLPGVTILIGGMWIANLAYWGCNQYITQRALAGKDLGEARKGMAFAAFLKVLMPLIVVVPGIAAFYLVQNGNTQIIDLMTSVDGDTGESLIKNDKSYPAMLALVPMGLKGITFAALIGAIVSSLSSMMNSTSTIFTMDIYKNYLNKSASENNLVTIGRVTGLVAIIIACLVTPLLSGFDQMFQFIQEFSGFITPGVTVIFLFGLFWKKGTAKGAMAVVIVTFVSAIIQLSIIVIKSGNAELYQSMQNNWFTGIFIAFSNAPFLDRMGFMFFLLSFLMILFSLMDKEDFKWKDQNFLMVLGCLFLFIIMEGGNKEMFHDTVLSLHTPLGKTLIHFMGAAMVALSLFLTHPTDYDDNAIEVHSSLYKSKKVFNLMALAVIIMLILIYTIWW
ncbi:MAG: sodium/sugar symporter [bacterium]|nr:sodium/sugar symporter [bacterium]